MRSSGYDGSALISLMVLNMGAAMGPLLVDLVADRVGSKVVTAGSFLLAVVGIAVLSHRLPMPLLYVAVVLAGIGTVGAQTLVNVLIASRYPVPDPGHRYRCRAVRWPARPPLYGSLLLSTGLPLQVPFSAFAAPAVIGAVLVTVMPTRRTAADAKQFLFDA